MEDEWSGLEGRGGGRIRAVAHKLTRLGGSQAAGPKRAWWKREMSGCAQMDTVEPEMSDRARQGMVKEGHASNCA